MHKQCVKLINTELIGPFSKTNNNNNDDDDDSWPRSVDNDVARQGPDRTQVFTSIAINRIGDVTSLLDHQHQPMGKEDH